MGVNPDKQELVERQMQARRRKKLKSTVAEIRRIIVDTPLAGSARGLVDLCTTFG
jgi:hypothetical protein